MLPVIQSQLNIPKCLCEPRYPQTHSHGSFSISSPHEELYSPTHDHTPEDYDMLDYKPEDYVSHKSIPGEYNMPAHEPEEEYAMPEGEEPHYSDLEDSETLSMEKMPPHPPIAQISPMTWKKLMNHHVQAVNIGISVMIAFFVCGKHQIFSSKILIDVEFSSATVKGKKRTSIEQLCFSQTMKSKQTCYHLFFHH